MQLTRGVKAGRLQSEGICWALDERKPWVLKGVRHWHKLLTSPKRNRFSAALQQLLWGWVGLESLRNPEHENIVEPTRLQSIALVCTTDATKNINTNITWQLPMMSDFEEFLECVCFGLQDCCIFILQKEVIFWWVCAIWIVLMEAKFEYRKSFYIRHIIVLLSHKCNDSLLGYIEQISYVRSENSCIHCIGLLPHNHYIITRNCFKL